MVGVILWRDFFGQILRNWLRQINIHGSKYKSAKSNLLSSFTTSLLYLVLILLLAVHAESCLSYHNH